MSSYTLIESIAVGLIVGIVLYILERMRGEELSWYVYGPVSVVTIAVSLGVYGAILKRLAISMPPDMPLFSSEYLWGVVTIALAWTLTSVLLKYFFPRTK